MEGVACWVCRGRSASEGCAGEDEVMGCIMALGCSFVLGIPCTVFREDKMSESFHQIPVQCDHMDGVSEPS